jgi:excisionase family DNA binding protein
VLKWSPMTIDDLGDRLFAGVPEAATILGLDRRTVRRAVAAGTIPATKIGAQWRIPTKWLREQSEATRPPQASAGPEFDELTSEES